MLELIGGLSIDLKGIEVVLATKWKQIRMIIVAPLLRVAVLICLVMTLMIFVEKLLVAFICLVVKVFKLKPEKRYKWKPMSPETSDLESGVQSYPMVLVCIIRLEPVYYKDLVEKECKIWKSKGLNIRYEVRNNRKGYKAGALKEGMTHYYVKDCDYVAMFDADFQPESDFLKRTVPFLIHNPQIALVQTRWTFVNADECLMTRMQEMSLDYHFKIEQEAGSSAFAFFGFNGTAGVWRISTIADAGGWKDRTTVEDMDLAVRSGLAGWKFVYVGDVKVKCELPSTFKAYRYQQHRWSCGPANLFKKMILEIIANKKVSTWEKIHLIYNFFFVGKVVAHASTYIFYCVMIPLSVLIPEVELPLWGVAYVPLIITLLKSVGTPRNLFYLMNSSLHLIIPWVLFENVMSLHRIKAATIGLLEVGRVNEWIVTTKLGDASKTKPNMEVVVNNAKDLGEAKVVEPLLGVYKKPQVRIWQRFHMAELWMGVFMFIAGFYDITCTKKGYFFYLFLQSSAFFIIGFNFIGTSINIS
ncbi:putative mannan synthase 11 [Dendrobium catenatum]|uniref:glucomannan 4-beta-mannosyltransferase n=1 Tax=Dendrobium catenatum TaxID=906689 RepID=A0A2I0VUC2_9ASPA|nr:putative mannan synthase 11 [Dendrobium catenatum]